MDGTQSSFIIDEDVLWYVPLLLRVDGGGMCACVLYVSAGEAQWFLGWGSETPEKSVLVISAVASVNSY